jgi:hypothetical protein
VQICDERKDVTGWTSSCEVVEGTGRSTVLHLFWFLICEPSSNEWFIIHVLDKAKKKKGEMEGMNHIRRRFGGAAGGVDAILALKDGRFGSPIALLHRYHCFGRFRERHPYIPVQRFENGSHFAHDVDRFADDQPSLGPQ